MRIRSFSLAPKRVVGELESFDLTLEVREAGATSTYTFCDCDLCDTEIDESINASKVLSDEELSTLEDYLMDVLSHDEVLIGLDGNIAYFADGEDSDDMWAAIRFGYLTVMGG